MDKYRVKSLHLVCVSPTRWKGHLDDDSLLEIVYNQGVIEVYLTKGASPEEEEITNLVKKKVGNEWEHCMHTKIMQTHISDILDFSNTKFIYGY